MSQAISSNPAHPITATPSREGQPAGAPRPTLRWSALTGIEVVICFVLLRSALAHLVNPYFFLSSIYEYDVATIGVGEAVALVLPHLQLVVAICLLLSLWEQSALFVAASMLTAFAMLQGIAHVRGLEISCGCFGATGSEAIGLGTILATFAWSALAWIGFWLASCRTTA